MNSECSFRIFPYYGGFRASFHPISCLAARQDSDKTITCPVSARTVPPTALHGYRMSYLYLLCARSQRVSICGSGGRYNSQFRTFSS